MNELTGQSYIAGNWVTPSGKEFKSFNPRTLQEMTSFKSCGSQEIRKALDEAETAYQVYRQYDGAAIGKFLAAIADEIEALGDQLLQVGDQETGLGIPRLTGERGRTTGQLRAFAQIAAAGQWAQPSIDSAIPDREPIPKPDIRRVMRPIGPVVVFGASNFPFAFGVLGGDTASALAAGNPVIVKGHTAHPGVSELFARAIAVAAEKCVLPKGIFSMLQGANRELGTNLVLDPITQAVGFTGSVGGGRALVDLGAQRAQPIPVYAEMGSINPVFYGPQTLAKNAAAIAPGLSGSVCLGTGQFCTCPGLVITTYNADFENKLKTEMDNIPRGVMLNKRIAESLTDGYTKMKNHPKVHWLNEAQYEGGTLTPPNAVFKTSAVDFMADESLSEEIFGPATLMVICDDEQQMLEVARNLQGNLTGSIHADEDPQFAKILTAVIEQKVGRVIYNGYPTGVEVCPSMQHGGPYPSSSITSSTSVGADAILRFARFVAYQNAPDHLLPDSLKRDNPLNLFRRVNGKITQDKI